MTSLLADLAAKLGVGHGAGAGLKQRTPQVPLLNIVLEPDGSSGNKGLAIRLSTRGGHAHKTDQKFPG